METIYRHLAQLQQLTESTQVDAKASYVHPARKNLGCVSLVLIREVIAPVVFRNAEAEITDIDVDGELVVRAVPNKFKYSERGRGLQILRVLGVGGRMAQNKTVLFGKQKPSEAFDLNTLVFGDSCNHDSRILPVKAAVNYSDALSLIPKYLCVDATFHNRASEDGTLFDAENKKNSNNLFTRHFVKPGTLLVQVLSTRGRVLPAIGLKHLLLSVGMAGSYGGQTSLTGTNIRTHLIGLYGGHFEQALSSPYELLRCLRQTLSNEELSQVATVSTHLQRALSTVYSEVVDGNTLDAHMQQLLNEFEQTDSPLMAEYRQASGAVANLFDQWFGN